MLYSRLFGKSVRGSTRQYSSAGQERLYCGGFIRESAAGRYYMLPLGMRVQDRICAIVEQEMNAVGAQKISSPALHPLELWQETKRDQAASFELMKVEDRRGASFVLGGTAEEMMVDLVRRFEITYRDLPFDIYQFSQKFRDELRARGGLLRTREFMMKDAYSFHADAEDFSRYYELMKEAYSRIFRRLGLSARIVAADNGYMGGDYSHEFIVEHETGESRFLCAGEEAWHEDVIGRLDGVQASEAGYSRGGRRLEQRTGIEVGNIFQLGTYYSERMRDACFASADNQKRPYYMGCYGIGIGRTLGAIAELYCDAKGIAWPDSVAPFRAQIVPLGEAGEESYRRAAEIYEQLRTNGVEAILDDRAASAGVKLNDADLVGASWRIVVSARGLARGEVEVRRRSGERSEQVALERVVEILVGNVRR